MERFIRKLFGLTFSALLAVDGNYVIVNNGWGNNNVWIEPSTTYLDGTIHFTN